ncbi:hypothetical protein KM043_008300 [Ampulex compressa]|nr:hypothetical protein KM043_008300 [Ampulex compressa]
MLYINCVCVLKACFEKINENLLKLKDALSTDEPHLLRRIYHEQWNPLLLLELRALKKCHLQIGDVINMLNATFSLQIVMTVVLTFAEVTFSLYFYILQQEGGTSIDTNKKIWYSYFVTSAVYYFIKLVLLAWACETSKNQALQIGVNVHEVLISTTNQQIKDELQLFSLQALHRDNLFTAKGLCMDATVLTKVVGGITTYLLILIQFMYANGSCNRNASNDTIYAK